MTIELLIDAIVRRTTVLIAQLATAGGVRAPLAHVANQVFLDLANELEAQGVSRKVSADMFGMALRAYVRKVQKLSESSTDRGRSLWEAVYDYLSRQDVVTRDQVLQRFHRDEQLLVRGVLHDLAESGLVFCTGTGAHAVYRAATEEELARMRHFARGEPDELVWVTIYREGPLDRGALSKCVRLGSEQLDEALRRLVEAGRVEATTKDEHTVYAARAFSIPLGASQGWEAALLDHFHAVTRTICQRLDPQTRETSADDVVGGSTYTLAVWPGHPLRDEVRSQLALLRRSLGELRRRVDEHNDEAGVPSQHEQVVIYCGQSVTAQEEQN